MYLHRYIGDTVRLEEAIVRAEERHCNFGRSRRKNRASSFANEDHAELCTYFPLRVSLIVKSETSGKGAQDIAIWLTSTNIIILYYNNIRSRKIQLSERVKILHLQYFFRSCQFG